MFVRFELNDGSPHEWGMMMDVVPQIGDTVCLYYEEPATERTCNWFLEAIVVRRQFSIDDDDEVWLTCKSDKSVPDGYIADSPAWRSDNKKTYAVQKAKCGR